MTRNVAVLALGVLLAGCMSVGTKVDPDVVGTFQPGVTTLAQAEARLGMPNSAARLPDGSTVIVYSFTHAQASGSSFIPIIGPLVGHSDANTVSETLTFNADGKYVQSSSTTAQAEAGMLAHH